ncbi:MAG: AlpA family phage regulatory protein [Pseudomonadales bacterium]|nr:AlpA family phage regulatory protein [Pseudomonadales bacterium]MCP5170835.1 AlpA family phage regulatory protein [Pseudomonadales bacterium]MCP5301925.1 AlpA family phage regulatory protein [Pseudomonadales bacterium]
MPTNIHTPKPPNTATPPDRLLRWSDVQPIVGICRSHAHQLAAKGLFPQPRKLVPGGRASAWVESEIMEWVEQRISLYNADSPESA